MASIGRSPISASLLRLDNPIRSLTLAFWLWKALLFIAVVACPGSGYDTSTTLLSYQDATPGSQTEPLTWSLKFARWDSIYFLHIAEQGYVFEQEWAFGYPRVLGWFISGSSNAIFETQSSTINDCIQDFACLEQKVDRLTRHSSV